MNLSDPVRVGTVARTQATSDTSVYNKWCDGLRSDLAESSSKTLDRQWLAAWKSHHGRRVIYIMIGSGSDEHCIPQ